MRWTLLGVLSANRKLSEPTGRRLPCLGADLGALCCFGAGFGVSKVVDWELVYNGELTASKWALNSAVECHLHTSSRFNTFNNLTGLRGLPST